MFQVWILSNTKAEPVNKQTNKQAFSLYTDCWKLNIFTGEKKYSIAQSLLLCSNCASYYEDGTLSLQSWHKTYQQQYLIILYTSKLYFSNCFLFLMNANLEKYFEKDNVLSGLWVLHDPNLFSGTSVEFSKWKMLTFGVWLYKQLGVLLKPFLCCHYTHRIQSKCFHV